MQYTFTITSNSIKETVTCRSGYSYSYGLFHVLQVSIYFRLVGVKLNPVLKCKRSFETEKTCPCLSDVVSTNGFDVCRKRCRIDIPCV